MKQEGRTQKLVCLATLLKHLNLFRVHFAVELLQFRFRVKQIHLARPAVLHQENHRPGAWNKMWQGRLGRFRRSGHGGGRALGGHQKFQGEGAQAQTRKAEHLPPGEGGRETLVKCGTVHGR